MINTLFIFRKDWNDGVKIILVSHYNLDTYTHNEHVFSIVI
jgi:hypothetical protein